MTPDFVGIAHCRVGVLEYVKNDDPIGTFLEAYGEWAQAEIDLLVSFLEPGDAAVDIGANVGSHSAALAQAVGNRGSVLAFEPQRVIFGLLEANMRRNGYANVIARPDAVGANSGYLVVPHVDYGTKINSGAVRLVERISPSDLDDQVSVVTIDDLALAACDLVKIDVEGMESAVLDGMARTIAHHRPVILVECNTFESGIDTLMARDWSGYSTFLARTSAFNPNNFRGETWNPLGFAQETSLLFVPDDRTSRIPPSSSTLTLIPVTNLETLAAAIVETPRGGDRTPFDRVSPHSLATVAPFLVESTILGDDSLDSRFRLAASQQALGRVLSERDVARSERDVARSERDLLMRSASWRMTKPLRAAKAMVQRLVMRG